MTARWYTELRLEGDAIDEMQRASSRALGYCEPPVHLKVQIQVSGYPLHDDPGILHLTLDWRFGDGPHMQHSMTLAENAMQALMVPLRLHRFALGEDSKTCVDCNLDNRRELNFVLRHPQLPSPLIIPRQDI